MVTGTSGSIRRWRCVDEIAGKIEEGDRERKGRERRSARGRSAERRKERRLTLELVGVDGFEDLGTVR